MEPVHPMVKVAKRLFDVTFSSVGLWAFLPAGAAIALIIKLDSRGPVFYKQRRAGTMPDRGDPESFWMYKFRTMVPDAEAKTGAVFAGQNDPRVTRIGRFLRKTRLDEVPQFINVLRGEMSVVGPRPERPELIKLLDAAIPFYADRMLMVRPGITGLAQIKLCYDGSTPQSHELTAFLGSLYNPFGLEGVDDSEADHIRNKLLYDFTYAAIVESPWEWLKTELYILVHTVKVMATGKGAW